MDISKIQNTYDNGNFTCGISVDFQKAFDTVNHKFLLINGTELCWFKAYLTTQQQYILK